MTVPAHIQHADLKVQGFQTNATALKYPLPSHDKTSIQNIALESEGNERE
jgi:hypothetical protein